jgi:drug/metabolite transporter (DMT)-like permease
MCVIGSLAGFAGLYFIAIPPVNRDALMLALGYIFGWGSAVVQSEYGASTTGRKVAESALRQFENPNKEVTVINEDDDAIPTKPSK